MRSLLAVLTRLMPLMFFVVALIALLQFLAQHSFTFADLSRLSRRGIQAARGAWPYLLGAAAVLWSLAVLGLWHSRKKRASRAFESNRSWTMDALDRLTNRPHLEERLRATAEPTYLDAAALSEVLRSKVIGQDDVCDDLAAQIRRRLALRTRGRPVGVFLFAGSPGTGKTYLAKVLAKALGRKLIHLDMTQFARGGAASTQLFGSSKGYVGSDSYGSLTGALREMPDAVVLLDEFEKAHPEVHKNFLTAWNDGFITEASDGRAISTTQSIFVMTTNAAIEALRGLADRPGLNSDEVRTASTRALLDWGFAPELLSRIDRIFVFRPLKGIDIARVGALEIEAIVQSYGLEVVSSGIDAEILYGLVRRQEKAGGEASSRDVIRSIEESMADSLIDAKRQGAQFISLIERGGRVVAVPAPRGPVRGAEQAARKTTSTEDVNAPPGRRPA